MSAGLKLFIILNNRGELWQNMLFDKLGLFYCTYFYLGIWLELTHIRILNLFASLQLNLELRCKKTYISLKLILLSI